MSEIDRYVELIARVLEEFMRRYLVLGVEKVAVSELGIDVGTGRLLNDLGLLRLRDDGYLELKHPSIVARSLCHLKRYDALFPLIVGYDDVKELICRSFSETGINILFIGPPASGKTLFLESIYLLNKDRGVYIDMSNTTPAGLLELLYLSMPEILAIDELDKPYDRRVYYTLSNILEFGNVVVTKYNKTVSFRFRGNVYGGANWESNIPEHIRDRFLKIYLRQYSIDEIRKITLSVLIKFGIISSERLAQEVVDRCIAQGITSIRDIIKISKLVKSGEDIKLLDRIISRLRRQMVV